MADVGRIVLWLKKPWQGHDVIGGLFATQNGTNGEVCAFVADMDWYLLVFKLEDVREVALIHPDPNGCPFPIVDPGVYIINGPDKTP